MVVGLGGGLAQQAEVPADNRRHRGHHRPGHQHGGDRTPHQQRALGAPQEQPAQPQARQPVGAEDVTGHQQRGMHEAEGDQPQAAPAQQRHPLPLGGPGRGLAQEQLHHPVAEQEREQRVDPQIQHGDHEQLRDPVQRRPADRMPP
jgi:hypothetical protein